MSELLRKLSIETGLAESMVRRILLDAPERYKDFLTPKKNGGKRRISQPARELKTLQRAFINILLSKLPVHPAATAYVSGKSIRDNAEMHALSGPILKMDFRDFFPSISERDWAAYCQKTGCIEDPADIQWSSNLLFHRPRSGRVLRLAIGAPSSPMLSNILLFEFDELISKAVSKDHVVYTRYADDLTFSAPRTGHLNGVRKTVSRILNSMAHPRLHINHDKTNSVTKKYQRKITGLVLANDGRVTIGRDKKRLVRARLDHHERGLLSDHETQQLAGVLAFIKSAEPEHYHLLVERYGFRRIQKILERSNNRHAHSHE